MTRAPQVVQFIVPPGVIDLGLGDPQLDLLPLELLRQAAGKHFDQKDPEFLQYGTMQGDGNFLNALAGFLSRSYGFPVSDCNLFITTGVSTALNLICTLFTQPGDVVLVEEPTYLFALRIFSDHHLRVETIPTDENGLVVDTLEARLRSVQPKFLYLIPAFQNPTGRSLSLERRQQLLEISQQRDLLIVADEVYHHLNYSALKSLPLAAYIKEAPLLSLGSFTKILAPGLRLGWIQASEALIRRLAGCGLLISGGGLNPFTSAIIRHVLESGDLEQNISKLVEIYRLRCQVMHAAIRHHLPEVLYTPPQGGYFFWVQLPGMMDASQLLVRAADHQVSFRPGVLFSARGEFSDHLRLCFVFYPPEELEQGIIRLKQAMETY
jgi:2-aminoadipate transaminase